jgi:hypothetical protein
MRVTAKEFIGKFYALAWFISECPLWIYFESPIKGRVPPGYNVEARVQENLQQSAEELTKVRLEMESLADPKVAALLDEMTNLINRMKRTQTTRFVDLWFAARTLFNYLRTRFDVGTFLGRAPYEDQRALMQGLRDVYAADDRTAILDEIDASGTDFEVIIDKVTRHLAILNPQAREDVQT